jgi:hypothetical protein
MSNFRTTRTPIVLGALAGDSSVVFFAATVVLGFGHGLAYVGSQELTDRIAPPAHRAEVLSGFQLGLYLGATLPSLLVGFSAAAIGFTARRSGSSASFWPLRPSASSGCRRRVKKR